MLEKILTDGFGEMGLTPHEKSIEQFRCYYELLEQRNKVMNLTAISGEEDCARLHFLDSSAALLAADLKGKRVIEVGTGAGFPGLPLKILVPELEIILLDSLNKRVNWLNEVIAELGLTGIKAIHARAEEQALVKGYRDSFDFVTARAVADLRLLGEICLPYAKVGGTFLSMKSVGSDEELANAAHAVKFMGGRVRGSQDYTIPGTAVSHRLIFIKKEKETDKKYPRPFAKIKKAPL